MSIVPRILKKVSSLSPIVCAHHSHALTSSLILSYLVAEAVDPLAVFDDTEYITVDHWTVHAHELPVHLQVRQSHIEGSLFTDRCPDIDSSSRCLIMGIFAPFSTCPLPSLHILLFYISYLCAGAVCAIRNNESRFILFLLSVRRF